MKFQRNYKLVIETNDGGFLTIQPELTLEFDIKRSTNATLNSAQLRIYNLSKSSADQIFQDRFNPKSYKRLVLQAGYGKQMSTVFIGNIFKANTYRNGSNLVTTIDAVDGGFDTTGTITAKTLQGGTTEDIVRALAGDFEKVTVGKVGKLDGEFKRPVILNGNTFELMKKYTEDGVFIDLEEINVLKENEGIIGDVPLINSDSGLISVKRDDAFLTVEMIFEPRIIMGQLLEIKSSVNTKYDGQYKVIGVQHGGVISGAVSGKCNSTFNLLIGSQLFGEFNEV